MKNRNNRKKWTVNLLILVVAVSAICFDIATASLDIMSGTFRFESEFDTLTYETTKVGIVTSDYSELSNPVERDVNPSYEQIEEMVGKAIELQGGFEDIIDPGDVVMLKINLVGINSASGNGENTDVRVVKALIKHIVEYTAGDVEILVAEGTAQTNDDPSDPKSVWGNSGYLDLLSDEALKGINFRLLNLNQSVEDLIEVDLGSKGTSAIQGSKYTVHSSQLEADVYIAVPVLKIHDTGITNALKLQIGSAPGCHYGYNKKAGTSRSVGLYHTVEHRVWTTEAIVDLCQVTDIDFVVVDAVMCLETEKRDKEYNRVRFNTILAGTDPVAIDHVAARLMGLNPDDVAYIFLAEKVGLGTNDPEHIVIEGVPINQAKKRVKKNQSEKGKFGQSNRTWILSEPFEGNDISFEYFKDEANIEPLPGQNDWSEPVYFFDDRIDLLSYYEGATNMVSYAFTYFNAVKDQEAELWLGFHEAIRVYLNGKKVYAFSGTTSYGDSDLGDYQTKVNLREGRNTLLVKTLNKFGDYTFALNLCELESDPLYFGNRVEGLKFFVDDLGSGTELYNLALPEYKMEIQADCYPNPAREFTNLRFDLARPGFTGLEIFDINGRKIKTLCNEKLPAGAHEFRWNLDSDTGIPVASGTYLCRIVSGRKSSSLKLIVE